MQRMRARRKSQLILLAGTDRVVAGITLPSDSVVHSVTGRVRVNSVTGLGLNRAFMCMMEAYVLPVLDVDAGLAFNTLWDNLVPKDTDVQTVDLDTGAADATPFSEPGEGDWTELLDIGLRPKKVYGRERTLTYSGGGLTVIPSTDILQWLISETFDLGLDSGGFRVSQPSVLLYAIGQPSLDDTTATFEATSVENEWFRHKYITDTVRDAMKQLFGLVEATAETPYVEAVALLQKLLEPDVFEETAAAWSTVPLHVWSDIIVDYSVTGVLEPPVLDSGR